MTCCQSMYTYDHYAVAAGQGGYMYTSTCIISCGVTRPLEDICMYRIAVTTCFASRSKSSCTHFIVKLQCIKSQIMCLLSPAVNASPVTAAQVKCTLHDCFANAIPQLFDRNICCDDVFTSLNTPQVQGSAAHRRITGIFFIATLTDLCQKHAWTY